MNENLLPENGTALESAPKKLEYPYAFDLKPIDGVFAMLFFAMGWIYFNCLYYITSPGVCLLLFTILYTTLVSIYASVKGHKQSKESVFWLVILLTLALSHFLYLNRVFGGMNTLAVHLVAIYWTMSRTGALIEGKMGKWVWLDGVRGVFYHPFHCFFAPFMAIKRSLAGLLKKSNSKSVWKEIAIGLLFLVPILMIILPSLFSADEGFAFIFKDIFNLRIDTSFVFTVIVSIIIGSYFFSLAFSCAGFKHDKFVKSCENAEEKAKVLPINSIKTIFYVVAAIYLLFVINSISTLWGFLANGLPQGHTYSSYARDGFFEMCWVAAFTLLLIGASVWTAKESWDKSFHLRLASVFLSVCSLGIIATALTKMGMYIIKQGLTPLRFFTTVFMLFLTMVFVLVIISTKKKINVPRISGLVFAVGFTFLTLINVAGIISSYNMSRYLNGTLDNETVVSVGFYKNSDETSSQLALFASLPNGNLDKADVGNQLYIRHKSIENGGDIGLITLSDIVSYYATMGYERYDNYNS